MLSQGVGVSPTQARITFLRKKNFQTGGAWLRAQQTSEINGLLVNILDCDPHSPC